MSHVKRDPEYDRDNFIRIGREVELGERVSIVSFVNLYGCRIGDDTQLGAFIEVQRGAVIGSRCKISSHTFICEGVTIEDECFIGHGVIFINDRDPRAVQDDGSLQRRADWICEPTIVKKRARIGSGAIIMGGLEIGGNALVGAGAVVTHDVPPGAIVAGVPARLVQRRGTRA